jgi:hypothetical protein
MYNNVKDYWYFISYLKVESLHAQGSHVSQFQNLSSLVHGRITHIVIYNLFSKDYRICSTFWSSIRCLTHTREVTARVENPECYGHSVTVRSA